MAVAVVVVTAVAVMDGVVVDDVLFVVGPTGAAAFLFFPFLALTIVLLLFGCCIPYSYTEFYDSAVRTAEVGYDRVVSMRNASV